MNAQHRIAVRLSRAAGLCVEIIGFRFRHLFAALPVADLAQPDSIIGMWATSPLLNRQIRIMEHWGFTYLACVDWVKLTKNGYVRKGTGYRVRTCSEFLVIGKLGEPPMGQAVDSAMLEQAREHSRKPDRQYEIIEKLAPNKLYAEVFATQDIGSPYWHHFGNQVGKYKFQGRVLADGGQRVVAGDHP